MNPLLGSFDLVSQDPSFLVKAWCILKSESFSGCDRLL